MTWLFNLIGRAPFSRQDFHVGGYAGRLQHNLNANAADKRLLPGGVPGSQPAPEPLYFEVSSRAITITMSLDRRPQRLHNPYLKHRGLV